MEEGGWPIPQITCSLIAASRCSIDTVVRPEDPDALIINCNREAGRLHCIAALHSTLELQYEILSICLIYNVDSKYVLREKSCLLVSNRKKA